MQDQPPLSPDPARVTVIPARSRRQAMDWSLVLVSQGIETIIQRGEDGRDWSLLVSAHDGQKAIKALRQYRVENRGWPWPQPLPWGTTRFDWTCLFWAALLIFFYWWSGFQPSLREAGALDSNAVCSGQWRRIFTAILLHADIAHLAGNLSFGIVILGLAMGRYGTGIAMLVAYLAGAAGNVASLAVHGKGFLGLGASGMVMGALGLLSAQTLSSSRRSRLPLKHRLLGLSGGVMLFILYGLSPGADITAHFGGFLAGLIFGTILVHAPAAIARNRRNNLISGFVVATLVLLAWRLALTG